MQKIAAELGCPPENVIVSVTHSHSAIAAILDAVRQAKAQLIRFREE